MLGVLGGLAASSLLAVTMPLDVIGPASPTAVTWIGWAVAGGVLILGLVLNTSRTRIKHRGTEGTQRGT